MSAVVVENQLDFLRTSIGEHGPQLWQKLAEILPVCSLALYKERLFQKLRTNRSHHSDILTPSLVENHFDGSIVTTPAALWPTPHLERSRVEVSHDVVVDD